MSKTDAMKACDTEVADLRSGAQYSTYLDLQAAIGKYCKSNNVQLMKANSRSVTAANVNVPTNRGKYPEKFVYSAISYRCKHSGPIRTTGSGVRPKQRSYKMDCPFKLSVVGNRDLDVLVVKNLMEEHNHETSEAIFKSYPEQRRLTEEERRMASKMLDINISASKVGTYLASLSGKHLQAKDIQNIKDRGDQEHTRLLNTINAILEDDAEAIITLAVNKDSILDFIYLQSSSMRANYSKYPEVLILDTTYKVNNKNMHLTSLMVVDGHGCGQVVAHGLMSSEKKDLMSQFLDMFVVNNAISSTGTEVILIDKDFSEIGAIEETMPGVAIQLCIWHIQCAMKRRLNQEEIDEQHKIKIRKTLQEITYANSQEAYDKLKEKLKMQSLCTSGFYKYFEDHWDQCRTRWVFYFRQTLPNFGNKTTNYLESFHQKLKGSLSKNTALDRCLKFLYEYSALKSDQSSTKAIVSMTSQSYDLKQRSPVVDRLFSLSTGYAANHMTRELKEAKKRVAIAEVKDGEKDGDYTVTVAETESYNVSLTDNGCACSCSFSKTMLMICRHAFMVILKKDITLQQSWIEERWHKINPCTTGSFRRTPQTTSTSLEPSSSTSSIKPEQVHTIHTKSSVGTAVPKTAHSKYLAAMAILKEIAGTVSLSTNSEFSEKLDQLTFLQNAWAQGETVIITKSHFTQHRRDEDASQEPDVSSIMTSASELSRESLSDTVKLINPNNRKIHFPQRLQLRKTVTKQAPERKTALGLKRKRSCKQDSTSKRKELKMENMSTSTAISALAQSITEEQLQKLFKAAENSKYIKGTDASFKMSMANNNPVLSREADIQEVYPNNDFESDVVPILLNRLKKNFDNIPDIEERTDIAHVMTLVLVYAYMKNLNLDETIPTIYDSPKSLDPEMTDDSCPVLPRKKSDAKFRIGNNSITLGDIKVLQKDGWLNDRMIHAFLGYLAQEANTSCPNEVFVLPSFLAVKWDNRDFSWMFEQVPLAEYHWVLLPICTSHHWILMVANMRTHDISILDSIKSRVRATRYISHWREFMKKRYPGDACWTEKEVSCSVQTDGSSCGVFVLMNAVAVLSGMPCCVFRQCHCEYFRGIAAATLGKKMKDNGDAICDLPFCSDPQKRQKINQWVLCSGCDRWCHFVCAGIEEKPKGRYMCPLCSLV